MPSSIRIALVDLLPAAVGCACLAAPAHARQSPALRSPAAPSAPAPLDSPARRLDAYVAPLDSLGIFSGVVLVAGDTGVALARAYGLASVELRVPMSVEHRFRIASLSKPFTRVLLGRLVDRGVLTLGDSIARWLPAYPSAHRITVRMLLDHRAGVPNVNSVPYDEEAPVADALPALVDSLAKLPLDFAPGTQRRYSNGGYALLARIVELATTRPFADALRDEVLRPLGLERTAHETDASVTADLASGYMPSRERRGAVQRPPWQAMSTKAGGGSMVSSAHDLVRFASAIGRHPMLSRETWAALFPPDTMYAWTGRSPGYNSAVVVDRKRGLTAVVLANNYAAGLTWELAQGALSIARGAVPAPLPVRAPVSLAPRELDALVGRYRVPDGALPVPADPVMEVRRSEGDLLLVLDGEPVDVLMPQGDGRFLARGLWSMLTFSGPDGSAAGGRRADRVEMRLLYRDHAFVATRVP